MKSSSIIVLLSFLFLQSQAQEYWQQNSDHTINVELDDSTHSLNGYEKIIYSNNSPDTLTYIWFHLWPNAYKNDKTAFSEQLLENGRTDFYFSEEENRGYINRLDFTVNGKKTNWEDHPNHQDIIKVLLPTPLPPNQSITIETPFHVKLPAYFSRSGVIGNTFMVTQWFPKPAVYDHKGWHPIPYLDQGEFYSEFGKYDVRITLPKKFTLAATGDRMEETISDNLKTIHFIQDNIHDFAFFASPGYVEQQDTLQLKTKIIKVFSYHLENDKRWDKSIAFIKNAVRTKSEWVGEYPYNTVKVFQRPGTGYDGMEYPTITLVATPDSPEMLEYLINHEVGHNWFYGILASNERDYPWMDEGMNSYYDRRYGKDFLQQTTSPEWSTLSLPFKKKQPEDNDALMIAAAEKTKRDVPIQTSSQNMSAFNYDVIIYRKAATWMKLLEQTLGRDTFDRGMKNYFENWKFRHPSTEDFKKEMERAGNQNLDIIFSKLEKKGALTPSIEKKKPAFTMLLNLKETQKKNYISLFPLVAYNYYDKFMPGFLLHNYSLPIPNFTFFSTLLFSPSSGKVRGSGGAQYSLYPGSKGAKLSFFINGSSYSADSYRDSTGVNHYLSFQKLVPGITLRFAPNKEVRSSIQWKTYLFRETGLSFKRDTTTGKYIISYPVTPRYLNQLEIATENNRALYPYNSKLSIQQSKEFMRLQLTLNSFFNYKKGGGLSARLFAGKFIYLQSKTTTNFFQTDRYHLNMTGPRGYEDYTYSDYFIGRNEFEGVFSQQIMIRDGGFKVRTDLLSQKIGKTDSWLIALNLNSTLPPKMNPLELFPIKIPLKVFADIGTYGDAWKNNPTTGKFLYDAGFQLSLLGNMINIYAPVLYSKEYRDYFNSTISGKKFFKTMSFSIDLTKFSLKKILPKEFY